MGMPCGAGPLTSNPSSSAAFGPTGLSKAAAPVRMLKTSKNSAYYNPRLLLAFSFCLVAMMLALSAFNGFSKPSPEEQQRAKEKSEAAERSANNKN
jgi:hypothetical protein